MIIIKESPLVYNKEKEDRNTLEEVQWRTDYWKRTGKRTGSNL